MPEGRIERKEQSKFAPKLLELGFKPISERMDLAQISDLIGLSLTRKERRRLKKEKIKAVFSMSDAVTFATDETGQMWFILKRVDLAHLGFYDNSHAVDELERAQNQIDPKLN